MDLFNNANPKKEDKKNMSSEAMPIGVGYKNTLQLFIQKCTLNFIVQKDIDDLFVSMTSLEQVIKDKNIYQPFIIIIKKWIEKWQLEIKRARVHKYVYPLKQNHKDFKIGRAHV